MAADFYSAQLMHRCLVQGSAAGRRHLSDQTIVVFRATSPKDALRKALKLGRSVEHEYLNSRGKRVRWAFVEVLTLDRIGSQVDGAEVWSSLSRRHFKNAATFRSTFRPESSKPKSAAPAGLPSRGTSGGR